MSRVGIASVLCSLCMLLSALQACSGSGAADEEPDSMTVGADGGSFNGPEGVRLIVPAGAVQESFKLSIVEIEGPDSDEFKQVGRFYRMSPENTVFTKDVTISIPYNPEIVPQGHKENTIKVWTQEEVSEAWLELPGSPDLEKGLALGSSSSLGLFGAAIRLLDDTSGNPSMETTDEVDFDLVAVGESDEVLLLVKNTGQGQLRLQSLEKSGDQAFSVDGSAFPLSLNGGEQEEISIVFEPKSQQGYQGSLKINSNDPNHPSWIVELSGRGAGGASATVDPERVDFGMVSIGSRSDRQISIRNAGGSGALVLYELQLDQSYFSADLPTLPLQIPQGGEAVINLAFEPLESGFFAADLILKVDDLDQPVREVELGGEAQGSGSDGDLETDGDPETDGDLETDGDILADGDSGTDGDVEIDGDSDVDGDGDPDPEVEADKHAEGDVEEGM